MRFSILAWSKTDIFSTKANCLIILKGCCSRFEVMMIMVLEKSIFRPLLSVKTPSSKTCKRTLKISGWAFPPHQIRELNMVCCGLSRSTRLLLRSPHSLEELRWGDWLRIFPCTHSYQNGMRADSSSNRTSAKALASSVFPTPVGPRNMKEPIGRLLLRIPDWLRRIARLILETAWSWPITRLCNSASKFRYFLASVWVSFELEYR